MIFQLVAIVTVDKFMQTNFLLKTLKIIYFLTALNMILRIVYEQLFCFEKVALWNDRVI